MPERSTNGSGVGLPDSIKLALVGGGRLSVSIMRLLDEFRMRRLGLELVGLADPDPNAEGMRAARERGIFTTDDFRRLVTLPGLGLIVELSGRPEVLEELSRYKPESVGLMDRTAASRFRAVVALGLELEQAVDVESSLARTLTEESSDGVMVLDSEYRILRVNRSACRWADMSPEEAPGRFCFQVLHNAVGPCQSPDSPCPMRETLISGQSAHCIHEFRDPDGEPHYCDVTTYPLVRNGERVEQVLEIFRDITQQMGSRMEQRAEAIKKDLARLVQEDKLLALGKLVASVAHEINNPISSIINFNRLMLRCIHDDPRDSWEIDRWEHWLQLSVDEAERCRQIVHRLLSFARQQSIESRRLDLVEIITRVVSVISHRLAIGKIEVDLHLPQQPLEVWGDSTQIQQCFTNLLFNALEAMPDGGRLTIEASEGGDGAVHVSVSDTGKGIPAEVMPKIFEPFFSTKSEVAGVGLGLPMVHGIVSEHGGRIEVDSSEGAGTTFRVMLPCAPLTGQSS